jgi:hypothetical protein
MRLLNIFFFLSLNLIAQSNFFKYSTLYISGSFDSPLSERPQFNVTTTGDDLNFGQLNDLTEVNPYNYNLTIGLRKIARFKYENRQNVFYDGSEDNISQYAPIGAVKGFEYLANFSMIRNRGEEFTNNQYWLRHLGTNTLAKIEYADFQNIKLEYYDAEFRYRKSFKKFNFTAGLKFRTHPVYGFNPVEAWKQNNDDWRELAYMYGYWDFRLQIPFSDSYLTIWYQNVPEEAYTEWDHYEDPPDNYAGVPNGINNLGSISDFYRETIGKIVERYNRDQLANLGLQNELSSVFGVSYYTYEKKFWMHGWLDIMPFNYGLSDYSFYKVGNVNDGTIPYKYDWDAGFILGYKINKSLGVFVEGTHQRYWAIENYNLKFGANYLFR